MVVTDNFGAFWADHREYLSWLRDPGNGFQSGLLALKEGTELSLDRMTRDGHGADSHWS